MEFSFKDFMNEARRGPVPGAFGKTSMGYSSRNRDHRVPQGRPVIPAARGDDRADYEARIAAGRAVEEEIFKALDKQGLVLRRGTASEDKYDGIDAWLSSTDYGKTTLSKNQAVQIKMRKGNSGNDILWEVIKPWSDNYKASFESLGNEAYTGKDMRCKADLLFCVGNAGNTIRIRKVNETIQIAKQMMQKFIENYRATASHITSTPWGEIRLLKDPSQQATFNQSGDVFKITAFINPDAYQWKKDFQLNQTVKPI